VKKVTAAIIEKDGKVLIAQRPKNDKLSLKWEFPGGKVENDETPQECLVREIKEELNLSIKISGYFMKNVYYYETGGIELMSYFAEITDGELELNAHEAVEWVEKSKLKQFDFAPADIKILNCFLHDFQN